MTSVFIRRFETQTRGDGHVTTEAEIRVMQP